MRPLLRELLWLTGCAWLTYAWLSDWAWDPFTIGTRTSMAWKAPWTPSPMVILVLVLMATRLSFRYVSRIEAREIPLMFRLALVAMALGIVVCCVTLLDRGPHPNADPSLPLRIKSVLFDVLPWLAATLACAAGAVYLATGQSRAERAP